MKWRDVFKKKKEKKDEDEDEVPNDRYPLW